MSAHQFRENGNHYNGGKVFFGYGYSAIGEPRLSMVRKWFRQGDRRGKTEDSFYVDGVAVESYAAAIDLLKSPPVFTPEEIAALAVIGDEAARHREIDWRVRYDLHAKGAVEYVTPGHMRRTDAGRAAYYQGPVAAVEVEEQVRSEAKSQPSLRTMCRGPE